MKTGMLIITGALAVCAGLVSCSELHSPHFVGEIVEISAEDLSDESVWAVDKDVYMVRRTGSNTYVAAMMEWDSKEQEYRAQTSSVVLSELDDHLFLNLQNEGGWLILRASCSLDESIVLFTIDSDAIKKDIAAGKIKARANGDDVFMECTKEEQDEYIRKNINRIFSYDCSRVARKIHQKESGKNKK